MLLVQQFLKNKSFDDLSINHGVYGRFSNCKRFVSLNYDQIQAKESDLLSQECRGLILARPNYQEFDNNQNSIVGDTTIESFPFKRFFNQGQGASADINWSDPNLRVFEKLDGTLCAVWKNKFNNCWEVSTRSVAQADVQIDGSNFTFRSLFEMAVQKTVNSTFEEFTSQLDPNVTYMFELTSAYNRIVVAYKETSITLLGARNIYLSGYPELDIDNLNINVPRVKFYNLNNLNEILDWVSTLNPLEHEGVVVRDSNFNRIKVKNAAYLAYSKCRDSLGTSDRNCLELILLGKDDDAIPFLPQEIVDNLTKIKFGLQRLIQEHDDFYLEILDNNPSDRKSFAVFVNQNPNIWAAPFFAIYGNKAKNMKDFILKSKKNGTWADSFLDKILDVINKFN